MAREGGKDRGLFERPAGSGVWWIRYHDALGRERREKARSAARQDLLDAIRAWDDVRRIQAFFCEAESEALSRTDEEREVLLGRLAIARELVGEADTLDMLMKWQGPEER